MQTEFANTFQDTFWLTLFDKSNVNTLCEKLFVGSDIRLTFKHSRAEISA